MHGVPASFLGKYGNKTIRQNFEDSEQFYAQRYIGIRVDSEARNQTPGWYLEVGVHGARGQNVTVAVEVQTADGCLVATDGAYSYTERQRERDIST